MGKNNHLQVNKSTNLIYCEKMRQRLALTEEFVNDNCLNGCPYFNGMGQGDTIECEFEDGTDYPYIQWYVNYEDTQRLEEIMIKYHRKQQELIWKLGKDK